MNLSNALPEPAQPLEIALKTRKLDSLIKKAHPQCRRGKRPLKVNPDIPALQVPQAMGLRTKVAVLPEQFEAAEQLVRKRYAWRGYNLSPKQVPESRCVTLLAEDQGRLLGTLTVRLDSPDGLLAEETYGAEIEGARHQGRRVAEITKLAVEKGVDSKSALDALVQSAYVVTHIVNSLTDVFIEVNPRHVRFYQLVLGFVVAASERLCSRVGAPSVLMQLDLEQFGRRLIASSS